MKSSLVGILIMAVLCLTACQDHTNCNVSVPSSNELEVTSQAVPVEMVKVTAKGGEYSKVIDILCQDPALEGPDAPYYVILAETGFGVDLGWHMVPFRKSQADKFEIGKVYFFELTSSDVFEITREEFLKGYPNNPYEKRAIFNYDNFAEVDLEKDFNADKTQSYWVLV